MGHVLTISGPSGVGKTTLAKALGLRFVESLTTRLGRPSDLPGEYRYLTLKEFEMYERRGYLLWSVGHDGNRYGTRRKAVSHALTTPRITSLMVVVPAVIPTLRQFAATYLETPRRKAKLTSLYIAPPKPEILHERLRLRGDTEKSIAARIIAERDWDAKAKELSLTAVRNDSTIEEALERIEDLL